MPLTRPGWGDRKPDIGGSLVDRHALLVYESDSGISGTINDATELYRVMVDADAGTLATATVIDPVPVLPFSLQQDRANPSVSQRSEGSPLGWMVCYQQRATFPDDWYVKGCRVASTGATSPVAFIVGTGFSPATHVIEPSVDGSNTRYAVTYLRADSVGATSGRSVGVTRFMWPPTASAPTVQWSSNVYTAAAAESVREPRIVNDTVISNWAVAYRKRRPLGVPDSVHAVRVGFNGAVVESKTVHSSLTIDGAAPAITYDFLTRSFLLTYGTDAARSPVLGRVWTYPTGAVNVPYGISCGGAFGAVTTPLVGTEFFRVRLTGARRGVPAVLLVGAQPAALDLGVIGMIGCQLLVDPAGMASLPAITDGAGDALVTLVGLTTPVDLYLQWAHVARGANPRDLLTTGGLRSQVR
ncbi:MAG: hypothetical protein AAF628_12175 [Planctomycetota bacterium]